MSNINSPNGFQFFGKAEGASPTVGTTTRKIASGNGNAIGFGDPVISLAAGYIDIYAAASGVQICGIFFGCEYYSTAVQRKVWSPNWPGSGASGDITAYLDTDPNSLFQAQSYNTAVVFADIDANIDVHVGTPQSTAGGFSTSAVDQSTIATTSTLPFRVVGLLSDYQPVGSVNGTDNASAYNRVIVTPNYSDRNSLVGIAS